ncbi:MAG: twin-arginine translocation signal domain-containing protein, partial [Candidatus Methylomirabilales bacterium]
MVPLYIHLCRSQKGVPSWGWIARQIVNRSKGGSTMANRVRQDLNTKRSGANQPQEAQGVSRRKFLQTAAAGAGA